MTDYRDAIARRGAAERSWETRVVHGLGLNYVILDAPPRPFGVVTSRHVVVLSDIYGKQLGLFRATREGEFIGWGWLEHKDGNGRTEYWKWGDMAEALKSLAKARGARERRGQA